MKKVLFVCIENSNRSQMAEAFARIHGAGVIAAFSAGSRPAGRVNPKAVAAMEEKGYDLATHFPKSLAEVPQEGYDYVVTMGCGDECPFIPATHREDWDLPDPRLLEGDAFTQIRDEIERRVLDLRDRL